MSKLRFTILPILVFALMFVAACGGGEEEAAPQAIELDVVQNDIYYGDSDTNASSPPTWTIPANNRFSVNMTNNGALEHNFAIVKAGETVPDVFNADTDGDIILQESGLTAPGSTAPYSFAGLAPGEYTVICTVAGHYPGMQGRIVVTDS